MVYRTLPCIKKCTKPCAFIIHLTFTAEKIILEPIKKQGETEGCKVLGKGNIRFI
jgi:hypothetical protein